MNRSYFILIILLSINIYAGDFGEALDSSADKESNISNVLDYNELKECLTTKNKIVLLEKRLKVKQEKIENLKAKVHSDKYAYDDPDNHNKNIKNYNDELYDFQNKLNYLRSLADSFNDQCIGKKYYKKDYKRARAEL